MFKTGCDFRSERNSPNSNCYCCGWENQPKQTYTYLVMDLLSCELVFSSYWAKTLCVEKKIDHLKSLSQPCSRCRVLCFKSMTQLKVRFFMELMKSSAKQHDMRPLRLPGIMSSDKNAAQHRTGSWTGDAVTLYSVGEIIWWKKKPVSFL